MSSSEKVNHGLSGQKGMVLYLVLSTLLIVIILSNALLSLAANQTRFTHHQVSRIQAYYAAQAGLTLAYEQLRLHQKESSGVNADWGECGLTNPAPPGLTPRNCNVTLTDATFPHTILNRQVDIQVLCPGQGTCPATSESACVSAFVRYTYTP